MKKIGIEFSITSLDSKSEFNTSGEHNGNHIIFEDEEFNKNYIEFHDGFIEYHKIGSISMKYIFKKNEITIGTYEVDGNKFVFDILTNKLEITQNKILIEYDLLLDNEVVNKSTLLIRHF